MQSTHDHATLDDIKQWPLLIDLADAAYVLGISGSHAYRLIKKGEFPLKTIRISHRVRVVTASLIDLLENAR